MRRLFTLLAITASTGFMAPAADAGRSISIDPLRAPLAMGRVMSRTFELPARLPVPNIRGASVDLGWSSGRGCGTRSVHRHVWRTACERVWVEPIYGREFVGYDHCHRPIYRTYLVREGYFRSVTYHTCGCGARY